MSDAPSADPSVGSALLAADGKVIGRIDAVFADYLLVRTSGLFPIDLYVPRPELAPEGRGWRVQVDGREAYRRWHRPLRSAPHD